ncbi:hypothetical protein ACU8DI_09080 [Psychroserpens sp. BH13MA-6]
MQFKNYIQTKFPFYVALSLTFLLASCGSYQYVGYSSDGIYDEEVVYEEATTVRVEDNNYYKDYFNEKSNQYDNIQNDDAAIFTDIDAYAGNYEDEVVEQEVQTGYAGWGAANQNVTINYYDNGWYNRGWGAFGIGWYNNYWGLNSPFWGWNSWYGYGWNNWGFGYGWNNWGYGFGYNGFWCPPGYYYGNGFYGNNNLAYNYGRRGGLLANNNRSISRRGSTNLSRRNTMARRDRSGISPRSNSTLSRPRTRNNSAVRPGTNSRPRVTRPRTNNSRPRVTRPRTNNSRPRVSTPRRSNSSPSVRGSSRGGGRSSSGTSSRGRSGRRG